MNPRDVSSLIDEERVIDLTSAAVSTYSPAYHEGPAMDLFADAAAVPGIGVQIQRVPAAGDDGFRSNVILRYGPQPSAVVWAGHLDTVVHRPGEPFRPNREGSRLYGLGAADMKGGCAAAVEALCALARAGWEPRHGITVALVVGEEDEGDGARALPQDVCAPLVIVGEPTGLRPCFSHHSYVELQLTARGRRSHASLPELGDSAIHAMMSWLGAVVEGAPQGEQDGMWINIRQVAGGSRFFGVAETCDADLDVHLAPLVDPAEALLWVNRAKETAALAHPGCTLHAHRRFWSLGFDLPLDLPAAAPVRRAFDLSRLPFEPGTFRSHSDAVLFRERGAVPIVCGPGQLEVAHTPDEHVEIPELVAAARLYATLFALAGA